MQDEAQTCGRGRGDFVLSNIHHGDAGDKSRSYLVEGRPGFSSMRELTHDVIEDGDFPLSDL